MSQAGSHRACSCAGKIGRNRLNKRTLGRRPRRAHRNGGKTGPLNHQNYALGGGRRGRADAGDQRSELLVVADTAGYKAKLRPDAELSVCRSVTQRSISGTAQQI